VTHISRHGIWLFTGTKEIFLSYRDFPWFLDAPIRKILNVEEVRPDHFYWPDLDIDISTEIAENPDAFPLKAYEGRLKEQ